MPPRIRTRVSKAQKENIDTRKKVKCIGVSAKAPRKALTDKTNSASDDNSLEVFNKEKKTVLESSNVNALKSNHIIEYKDEVRPRRDRRLPNRFVDNEVVTSLGPKKDNVATKNITDINAQPASTTFASPIKKNKLDTSSFVRNSKADTSLVVCRPRRICRLPSRFNDHSISPSKFIPLQPQNASTPLQQSKAKVASGKNNVTDEESPSKQTAITLPARAAKTLTINKVLNNQISPDTNNNAKKSASGTKKLNKTKKHFSPKKVDRNPNTIKNYFNETSLLPSPAVKKVNVKTINDATLKQALTKIQDVTVLGNNKRSLDSEKKNQDIYEFTFDPNEEPQPQKKKRKKPVIKKVTKVTKPKAVVTHKTTYDQNISKALAALKQAVQHSKDKKTKKLPDIVETIDEVEENVQPNNFVPNFITVPNLNDTNKTPVHPGGYCSIRIEDIAADIEGSVDNLNYSPVNSPHPKHSIDSSRKNSETCVCDVDPLNLQEDISFFDDIPVANSSMNTSVRHPLASPWRVEFNNLPIKWHNNTYVKPNMTPAVESSFICSEESTKRKHVYTNLVPEAIEPLPEISSASLKQPSIISFIKEVTEKALMKKRKYDSPSKISVPESSQITVNTCSKQAVKQIQNENVISDNNTSEKPSTSNSDLSNEKEKLKEKRSTRKLKNKESPQKQKSKDCTYFGFDESENLDQENVSPVKTKENISTMSQRLRQRPVLQEINGPSRAILPVAVKSKTTIISEAVNKTFEGLKSAADAPLFPGNKENNMTNIHGDPLLNDDSQSIHLFEDIEFVHHLKPTRKSYGNTKKVTFLQQSASTSDTEDKGHNNDYSEDDDFGDLTFELPNVKEKKKAKKKNLKKIMSKKEEKEAEAWAAGFNSMCEEIEDFPLVVE